LLFGQQLLLTSIDVAQMNTDVFLVLQEPHGFYCSIVCYGLDCCDDTLAFWTNMVSFLIKNIEIKEEKFSTGAERYRDH
jgi:hypothetical protein